MLNIEINGQAIRVRDGATIMDAAEQGGVYIPRFCYHRKLSIAANCRMCLVEVEGVRKPMPACVTPVTDNMKVHSHSPLAVAAQKAVMEFLLINHPLDCPICDQGGECQLQDLAVGYGTGASHYREEKRVVLNKDFGPLIGGDMTRCIQCTRCIRFGQEISGIQEFGMANRGEFSEVVTFLGREVGSEMSGNVIDLCPVGALTSKPFRYRARGWELNSTPGVAPHDALGSRMRWQGKDGRVLRVLPEECDDINECWLSDRDRFSYTALAAGDRLQLPMVKRDGAWRETHWEDALQYAAQGLADVREQYGAEALGALLSPQATLEELHLAAKLWRALGSQSIDSMLRAADPCYANGLSGAPWLGGSIADLSGSRRLLLVGASLRSEQPLLAARVRRMVAEGGQLWQVAMANDPLLCPLAGSIIAAPSGFSAALARLVSALAAATGHAADASVAAAVAACPADDAARTLAGQLLAGEGAARLLLGATAAQLPDAGRVHALALEVARLAGFEFGMLPEACNSVGAAWVGAVPGPEGRSAAAMLEDMPKGLLLWNVEPARDLADAARGRSLCRQAFVVAVASFREGLEDADVILPLAAPSEGAGSYVNMEGRRQTFGAATLPPGQARPGWKILRVLANLLQVPGFDYRQISEVEAEIQLDGAGLDNTRRDGPHPAPLPSAVTGEASLERFGETGIYFGDPLVRRAAPLAATRLGRDAAFVHPDTLASLGLGAGERVEARQGAGAVTLDLVADRALPAGVVRIRSGGNASAQLGPAFGAIELGRAGQ